MGIAMSFSDDDLRRLKEYKIADNLRYPAIICDAGHIKALLARLEAAETALINTERTHSGFCASQMNYAATDKCVCLSQERYDAWRKSAGR